MNVKKKMKSFIEKSKLAKTILPVLVTILLLLILGSIVDYLYNRFTSKLLFENQVLAVVNANANPDFEISKIVMISSATSQKKEEKQKDFWSLNPVQYTDIALYLQSFDPSKSIKDISIRNVNIWSPPSLGTPGLYYKNPMDFGKAFENIEENRIGEEFHYEIISPEKEPDLSKPQFPSDFHIPIVLTYFNKEIKKNCIVSDISTPLTYNGSLLKRCNITLNSIACQLSFNVYLTTTSEEKYISHVTIEIPLEDKSTNIYEGSYTKIIDSLSNNKFYKLN